MINPKWNSLVGLVFGTCFFVLGGLVSAKTHGYVLPQGKSASKKAPATKSTKSAKPVAQKTPTKNVMLAPGILVFEPVAAPEMDSAEREMSAGWGDWLFFTVGGLPELGQTPMISSVSRVQRELNHRQDLRLTLEEAKRAAKMTGANRIAVGAIRRIKPGSLSLTYTLYDVSTGKALGEPLLATGTADSIRTQLPVLATEMAHRLGIASPIIPNKVEESNEELGAVGRTFWAPSISASDLPILETLSPRTPLAAITLLGRDRVSPSPRFTRTVASLLGHTAAKNPLAWAYVAYTSPTAMRPYLTDLAALRQKYPHNYALAHTMVWMSRVNKDTKAERLHVEATVQNAPQNPEAWLALGQTFWLQASTLRKGRFADDISAEDWKTLQRLYPLWAHSVLQATELDPIHETAWLRVATAATFYGDGALARKAFANAEKYSHDIEDVYLWGFQMFDQKWGGTPEELNTVVAKSVKADYPAVHPVLSLIKDLKRIGRPEEARALATRLLPMAENTIRSMPDLNYVYYDKISLLEALDQGGDKRPEILAVSESATRSLPEDPWVHLNYAQRLSSDRQQAAKAEAEYRTALRLEMDNVDAMAGLGALLVRSSTPEAEKLLIGAVQLEPENANAHAQLGFLYTTILREKKAQGIEEYEKAISCGQRDILTLTRLSRLLSDGGKPDKAEPYAIQAVQLYPKDVLAYNALAYVFLLEGKLEDATKAGQLAFAIKENDTEAHINFGLIQNARGDRREARREWERVVASQAGKEQKERAQGYLTKYPEGKP